MILASHPLMLRQHYGLPIIVALNRFGSDTEREFEMIRKHLGEQGVEPLVCEHFAKGSRGDGPEISGPVPLGAGYGQRELRTSSRRT